MRERKGPNSNFTMCNARPLYVSIAILSWRSYEYRDGVRQDGIYGSVNPLTDQQHTDGQGDHHSHQSEGHNMSYATRFTAFAWSGFDGNPGRGRTVVRRLVNLADAAS